MRYLDKNNLIMITKNNEPFYLTDRHGFIAYPYKDTHDTLNALKVDTVNAIERIEGGDWQDVAGRMPVTANGAEYESIDGCLYQLKYSKWAKKNVQTKRLEDGGMLRDSNGYIVASISYDKARLIWENLLEA